MSPSAVSENDLARSFREDMRRAGFSVEDAVILLWTLDKPVDACLTVTELELFDRFYRAFCGAEAGAS